MHIHTPDEINAMPAGQHKVLENKLRRMLERRGYRLHRSRTRDLHATTYGGYIINENITDRAVAGHDGFGWTLGLDDIERWLAQDQPRDATRVIRSNPTRSIGA